MSPEDFDTYEEFEEYLHARRLEYEESFMLVI